MKLQNVTSAVVLAGLIALGGCAATGTPTVNTDLQQTVQDSVSGNGDVLVSVVDGVATLTGTVEDGADRDRAEEIVMNAEGVNEVVNLISIR